MSLVINFLGVYWQPKHNVAGCFQAFDTSRHALPDDLLTNLLNKYDLRKNINAHVKNEGSNLNPMTIVFNYVVSCNVLSFIEIFRVAILTMHSLRLVNMFQLMKKFIRV